MNELDEICETEMLRRLNLVITTLSELSEK